MTPYTLYEHEARPFTGEGAIPEPVARRLHGVSARTGFAKAGSDGVLRFGRESLKAREIVGIVATDGACLEILPKIDVHDAQGTAIDAESDAGRGGVREQLMRMLGVALDLKIDAGALTALGSQRHTLLEMLIRLFAAKLSDAVRAGMPRKYIECADDLTALRGRLDVIRQFTLRAADPSRLACRFQALTADIALNRIMKAAVQRLSRLARAADTQALLRELGFAYMDVAEVPVSRLDWDAVVLDRTNARWRDLLALAELLLKGRFQTSSAGGGRGFALLFDMNMLFERYVVQLARRAVRGTDMRVVAQGGLLACLTAEDGRALFRTKPDILIKRGDAVVRIIDTKWKRLSSLSDDDRKGGVSQGDVYQMMAYGRLYGCGDLMLLFPHHRGLGAVEIMRSHTITASEDRLDIATINVTRTDPLLESHFVRPGIA